jgi:uncharacterized protein
MTKLILFFSLSTLPTTLLWVNVIPYGYRFGVLAIITFLMIGYSIYRKFSLHELGFRKDTLNKSLILNGLLSLILLLFIGILYGFGLIRHPNVPNWDLFFVFYIFFSSPAQEFLFRSLVFAELLKSGIKHPVFLVVITSLNFAYLHIFYRDPLLFSLTLLLGFIWGIVYLKYPNFWGVALSHAVLGTVSILVGLI